MVLTRNEFYPAPSEPAPTTVIIDFYQRDGSGESLAAEAFRNHEADALGPTAAWEYLRSTPPGSVSVVRTGAFIWEVLFLQTGEQRLATNQASRLDEVAVRRAVLQAVDRDNLATVVTAAPLPTAGNRIDSLVEFFTGVENPSGGWGSIEYDPEAAAEALGEPVPLVYTTTSGMLTMDIGTAVVESLTAGGFEATADFGADSRDAFALFNDGGRFFAGQVRLTLVQEGRPDMVGVWLPVPPDYPRRMPVQLIDHVEPFELP